MNNEKLQPCPFCSGEGVPDKTLRDGYQNCQDDPAAYAHFIICRSCAAQGGWAKNPAGAIRWWNMRQPFEKAERLFPEGETK